MIREPVYPVQRVSQSMGALLRRSIKLAQGNSNFRRLLLARALTTAGLALAPFYVVYARQEVGVGAGMVGLYLSAQMAGGALSNLLWGWLGDRFGNRSVLVGVAVTGGMAPLLALLAPTVSPLLFVPVFVFLGATISGMRLGYSNFILEMAPLGLRPTCVALQNTLLTPVALLPLAVGGVLSILSYPLLLGLGVGIMTLNVIVAARLLEPRHGGAGACVG